MINRESVAALFGIGDDRLAEFVVFEPANAIKFSIRRLRPNGSPGEHDVTGAQQYAALFDIEVPDAV